MKSLSKTLKKFKNWIEVQDFLDRVPFNFEKNGETYRSPQAALKAHCMHCFEGALFACMALQELGVPNYLLDLKVKDLQCDSDHTLCVFRLQGYWGAISKTNHSVLRARDPIYRTLRELAMSYFHEYFLDTPRSRAGEKTLKSYSAPFDIWRRFGVDWLAAEHDLDEVALALDKSRHYDFVPRTTTRNIRRAGATEIKGAAVQEWSNMV